jgi:hypothetical protein
MQITVKRGQSLTDIAVQMYGSAEAVYTLAAENGIEDITASLSAGTVLQYSSDNVINRRVSSFYADNDTEPVTAFEQDLNNRLFDDTFDLTFD